MEETIDQLLKKLSIQATTASGNDDDRPTSSQFLTELNNTKFTIFVPLSDYGYFGWKPNNDDMPKSLATLQSSNEIIDQIVLHRTPPKLVSLSQLRLPQRFCRHLPAQQYSSLYPYGQYHIASLHVATRHRGVDLNEFDFCVRWFDIANAGTTRVVGPLYGSSCTNLEEYYLGCKV
jgi:hypothetical protein